LGHPVNNNYYVAVVLAVDYCEGLPPIMIVNIFHTLELTWWDRRISSQSRVYMSTLYGITVPFLPSWFTLYVHTLRYIQ